MLGVWRVEVKHRCGTCAFLLVESPLGQQHLTRASALVGM